MIAIADLDRLSAPLRLSVREWLAGVDLRARLPSSTFSRHRRALLPFGIDIGCARAPGEGLPPCLFAEDCWDWLRPGEVARVAELALADVQRRVSAPIPDGEAVEGWFDRDEFLDQLAHLFALRLSELGRARGLEGLPNSDRDLASWLAPSGSGAAARAGASHD
jgi:hypothetical protein